jgi:magnesium-transporting ATPase (P-type)
MNLDGETNLKEKIAVEQTRKVTEEELSTVQLTFEIDQPNMSLNRWNCKARVDNSPWIPFGMNQLLLRGFILKNTEYAYGVVAYTGHETKAMLNSKEAPHKTSNVLRKMNKILYTLFVFQGLVCLSFGLGHFMWDKNAGEDHTYLDVSGSPDGGMFIIYILTFIVAYSHLIPISLYVALEVVKLALAYMIT